MRCAVRRLVLSIIVLGIALSIAVSAATPGSARTPFLPSTFIQQGRQLRGDTIRFCVDAPDPLLEFHTAVGEFIASSLLLNPDFYYFDREIPGLVDGDELYMRLMNDCEAFLGYEMAPHSDWYPGWMHTTRGYYRGEFVLAARQPTARLQRLDGKRIGTVLGSIGGASSRKYRLRTSRSRPEFPEKKPTVFPERVSLGDPEGGVCARAPLEVLADVFSDSVSAGPSARPSDTMAQPVSI